MALQFVAPEAGVLRTYQQSLLDFMGPQPPALLVYHLPVGALGLTELTAGATLGDVLKSGCRFLTSWPGSSTSCEMTNPDLYGNAEFRNFTTGDSVDLALARIGQAQSLAAVQTADYELHFLSIPALYLEALHLVPAANAPAIILPLLSIEPEMGADTVLEEAAFLAIASASAAARIKLTSIDPLSS